MENSMKVCRVIRNSISSILSIAMAAMPSFYKTNKHRRKITVGEVLLKEEYSHLLPSSSRINETYLPSYHNDLLGE